MQRSLSDTLISPWLGIWIWSCTHAMPRIPSSAPAFPSFSTPSATMDFPNKQGLQTDRKKSKKSARIIGLWALLFRWKWNRIHSLPIQRVTVFLSEKAGFQHFYKSFYPVYLIDKIGKTEKGSMKTENFSLVVKKLTIICWKYYGCIIYGIKYSPVIGKKFRCQ